MYLVRHLFSLSIGFSYLMNWLDIFTSFMCIFHHIFGHSKCKLWFGKLDKNRVCKTAAPLAGTKTQLFFADHVGGLPLVNSPLLLFQFRIASSHPPPTWPFVVWWLRRDMCSPTKLVCLCLLSSHNTFEDEDQLRRHVCQFTARCDRGWISEQLTITDTIAKLESWHWGLVIDNQRVTWTAFAILAMFL